MALAGPKRNSIGEWEILPVGKDGLPEHDARRLHAAAKRAARRLGLPVLTRVHQGLKAGQVVGILSVPGQTLEILPKINAEDGDVRAALIHMLAVAWDLRLAEGELTILDTQRHDLLELLIRLFANRLLAAVRRGLPRRYVAHEEDLALLRGRLDVKRQFTHLAVRPDRLACRFDELSEDTPLNRVLKAAVTRLVGVTRSAANARRLSELAARFEFVGDSPAPLRETGAARPYQYGLPRGSPSLPTRLTARRPCVSASPMSTRCSPTPAPTTPSASCSSILGAKS